MGSQKVSEGQDIAPNQPNRVLFAPDPTSQLVVEGMAMLKSHVEASDKIEEAKMQLEKDRLSAYTAISFRILWIVAGLLAAIAGLIGMDKNPKLLVETMAGIGVVALAMLASPTIGRAIGKSKD